MTQEQPLQIEDQGSVRYVTFNRPRQHNAQTTEMLIQFREAMESLGDASGVRALVLGGRGPSFSSGHDLTDSKRNLEHASAIKTAEGRRRWERRLFAEPVQMLRELRIPTVCVVQGHCIGAGLMFASVCDFVIAADDARFSSPVIYKLGLNDAELPTFAWAVGSRLAKEVLWLGEEWDARRAKEAGLVNWVVPRDELSAKTAEVVGQLARVPAETLALSKETLGFMEDRRGYHDVSQHHFMSHSFSHYLSAVLERKPTDQ